MCQRLAKKRPLLQLSTTGSLAMGFCSYILLLVILFYDFSRASGFKRINLEIDLQIKTTKAYVSIGKAQVKLFDVTAPLMPTYVVHLLLLR